MIIKIKTHNKFQFCAGNQIPEGGPTSRQLVWFEARHSVPGIARRPYFFSIEQYLINYMLQMYLCILREAAGVENDKLPENASELRFVHDHVFCSRIDVLMEKHRSYYVTNIELGTVDARYEQQRRDLMDVFDNFNATTTEGTKSAVLNESKAFQLLQSHRVVVFKQRIVTFLQEVEEKVSNFCFFVNG